MWPAGGGNDARPLDRTASVPIVGPYYFQGTFVGTVIECRRPSRRSERSSSLLPMAKRLLGSRRGSADARVTCIACGTTVSREEAREYDKQGDRWDREDKRFEYLCKPCHGDLNHQPRDELEALLVELDAGDRSREEFLQWYCGLVEERYGPIEEE